MTTARSVALERRWARDALAAPDPADQIRLHDAGAAGFHLRAAAPLDAMPVETPPTSC
ncbi:hypothetical protein [Actinoplanes sp. NPDC051494]|uniref:hypothetical protein n=1 Tax=Actinoplanes sp. NPDC051494 TaxID=3363907 RepID=UPI00378F4AD0